MRHYSVADDLEISKGPAVIAGNAAIDANEAALIADDDALERRGMADHNALRARGREDRCKLLIERRAGLGRRSGGPIGVHLRIARNQSSVPKWAERIAQDRIWREVCRRHGGSGTTIDFVEPERRIFGA